MQSRTDWKKAARQYVTGDMSLAQLARQLGIPAQAVYYRARKEGWTEQRRRYQEQTRQSERPDKLAQLKAAADGISGVLARLVEAVETQQAADGDRYDTRELKNITACIKEMTAVQRELYGAAAEQPQEVVVTMGEEVRAYSE